MTLVTRQFGPNAKYAKLSISDMDFNLYYLQGLGTSGITFSNNNLTIINPTGGTNSVMINTFTGLTVNGNIKTTTISATTYQNLPPALFTGGTVPGNTIFTNGLSANTIYSNTYQNLPQDIFVTGGTYTNGEILFKNNSGGSFTVTGLPIGGAGGEVYYLNLSQTQLQNCINTWATENFSGTTFKNGDTIPQATNITQWTNASNNQTPAWCYYNFDSNNGPIYGKLYNWYVVGDPRGVGPSGYIVPSESDWDNIESCLGGNSVAGGKLKTTGTTNDLTGLWDTPNAGATNESGFSGIPGGYMSEGGASDLLNRRGGFWTTTESGIGTAMVMNLNYGATNVYHGPDSKGKGYSIRLRQNISPNQTPYKEFSPVGTNGVEQTTGVTINSGVTSIIASFLTPIGYPNASTIPAGYWSFYIHSYKDSINASFDVFCEVYVRTVGGTETLILTTEGADVPTYSPTVSMQLTDGYYSGGTIDITDRILVKVKTTNTGTQTNTITFFTEGQQHYSYGVTPFSNFNILTCDTLSGCTTIVNLENNKVNKSGDVMTGNLTVPSLSATTMSGTTLYVDQPDGVAGINVNNINDSYIRVQRDSSLDWGLFGVTVGEVYLYSRSPSNTMNFYTDNLVRASILPNGNMGINTTNPQSTLEINGDTITDTLTTNTISATTYNNLPDTTSGNYLPLSGGTMTGGTVFQSGLTATTISATTYQNLPVDPDTYVTGFTYGSNIFTIKRNNGQPDLTALINSVTGWTVNGDLTVTGNTSMKSVTATTVSASTLTLVSPNVPPTPSVSTPFIDDYTRGTLSPGGTPSLTYTNTNTGGGNSTIVTNYLNLGNGTPAGQSYTTVPLSGFSSPFNPTLSSNNPLSTIEWSFNLRTNRSAAIFGGFGAGSYGGAVVLVGSNTNLQSAGSGYALVYGTTSTRNWKLVKYNNGLAGTQTDIITGGLFSGNTNYVSARIVYTPSTNTWSYYFRDDGATAWGDPTTTSTLIGSAVDSTYTSTLMSVFGSFFNYSTAASQNLQFDNLRVQQSVSPSTTTIDQLTLKNNSGTDVFKVKDDGTTTMSGTVTSSVGFFGSFTGTHLGNGSSLTLGQSGVMVTGTTALSVTNATTALTLIPGLSTTITVSGQTMVYIQTNGGVNTTSTSISGGSALDIAILVDGSILPSGGYQRIYADNPTGTPLATVTNWVANWNTSVILTLAAGSHTIEVDAVYVAGATATVSGIFNSIKQGTLTVMVLKSN